MKRKSKKLRNGVIIGLFIIGLVVIGLFVFGIPQKVAETFTPVYCNDYSFTCCVEKHDIKNQQSKIYNDDFLECPDTASRCDVKLTSQGDEEDFYYIGSVGCRLVDTVLTRPHYECDDERKMTTFDVVSLKSGEIVYNSYRPAFIGGKYPPNVYTFNMWREELIFTGRAGSSTGVPVDGADGCTFNPSSTYKDGKLVDYEETSTSYTVSEGECLLTFVAGDRHICGNIEEQCSVDTDCGGHTYGNKECTGRTLQTYGCRQFTIPNYLESYSSGYAYKPFKGDNDGDESALSRCEIISAEKVQCCGDNDCGSNAFCDTTTFTCEKTASCKKDSDCGVSIQCDINSKELKKPVCDGGECAFDVIQSVQCCSTSDCPTGYFCDDYQCKESTVPKKSCPFDCCVGEVNYLDKECEEGKFCIDNTCKTEGCKSDDDCNVGEVCVDGNCEDYVPEPLECTWYQEEVVTTEKDYGLFYWRAWMPFVEPETKEARRCETAGWVTIVAVITTLFIFALIIYGIIAIKRRMK